MARQTQGSRIALLEDNLTETNCKLDDLLSLMKANMGITDVPTADNVAVADDSSTDDYAVALATAKAEKVAKKALKKALKAEEKRQAKLNVGRIDNGDGRVPIKAKPAIKAISSLPYVDNHKVKNQYPSPDGKGKVWKTRYLRSETIDAIRTSLPESITYVRLVDGKQTSDTITLHLNQVADTKGLRYESKSGLITQVWSDDDQCYVRVESASGFYCNVKDFNRVKKAGE